MTIVLLVAAVIFGLGWLVTNIGLRAVIKYMADKGYTPPSDEEMQACCKAVLLEMLHK